MTQEQRLEQVVSELGISCRERKFTTHAYASEAGTANVAAWDISINLSEGVGLPGFVASFCFDANDSFLAHRVWKRE